MISPKLNRVLPAFALLLLFLPAGAWPYTLLSPNRTWDSTPVLIVDNRGGISTIADGDGGTSRVVSAINGPFSWNGAGAGTLVLPSPGWLSFVLGDGVPIFNLSDPFGVCTGNCLAATFITYYSQRSDGSWKITDADIVTNSTGFAWTSEGEDPSGAGCSNEAYIEGVAVHEVGHLLGLDHSGVSGATMESTTTLCNNSWATLETDDRNGILALYQSAPCTNCHRYYGYLTGTGDTEMEPNDNYFYHGFAATHTAWLVGPGSTNFDVYLEYSPSSAGGSWTTVASATTSASSEFLSYSGAAGSYRWRVQSASGSGAYRLYWER